MELEFKEKIIIWYSLVKCQKEFEKGSENWFRFEKLIRRLEKDLNMTERPIMQEVKNEG